MDIPSFEDFWATLDADEVAAVLDRVPPKAYQLAGGVTEENLFALLRQVQQETLIRSMDYSRYILQKYHEWVVQQL